MYNSQFFEWLNSNPEEAFLYQNALEMYSVKDSQIILDENLIPPTKTIIDIGGGSGVFLRLYLEKFVDANGILLDLSESIEYAKENTFKNHLITTNSRIQFLISDFFQFFSDKLPYKPEIGVLFKVLHDWDDKRAKKILDNLYKNLVGVELFVVEIIKDEFPTNDKGAFLNLNMKVMTQGKERTLSEWKKLIESCNYKMELLPSAGLYQVLHLIPVPN